MELDKLMGIAESVLFASGEPVSMYRLCEISGADKKTMENVLTCIGDRISTHMCGIMLLRLDDKYQLCTREEYGEYVRRALDNRRQTSLSQAALEVLSVTAYNQPVTKAYIEQIRGVDCSGVLETLREKNLVEERGRLDAPGKPLLYGTTTDFLRVFNISSLDELPSLPSTENEENEVSSLFNDITDDTEKDEILQKSGDDIKHDVPETAGEKISAETKEPAGVVV